MSDRRIGQPFSKRPASRGRFLLTAGSAGLGVMVIGTRAKAAEFEFKCAGSQPIDHPASIRMKQMWAAIKSESKGRLDTQYYPNSQLGGDAAMLSQARLGALGFLLVTPGNLSSVVPVADITSLGFAYKDPEDGARVMAGPLGEYLRNETEAKGLHVVDTGWDLGMLQICSGTRPIRTPDDLKGFKIRVAASRITIDLFKAFDASPVAMSLSEAYTGLQTKLIDGAALSLATIETGQYYEVQRFASLTAQSWANLWVVANPTIWKSLPPDLQAIVSSNARKYGTSQRRDVNYLNLAVADKLGRQGLAINPVDLAPFRARLRGYYQSWATTFGPTAWGLLESGLGRKVN